MAITFSCSKNIEGGCHKASTDCWLNELYSLNARSLCLRHVQGSVSNRRSSDPARMMNLTQAPTLMLQAKRTDKLRFQPEKRSKRRCQFSCTCSWSLRHARHKLATCIETRVFCVEASQIT
jgi:hypothetical protein